MKLGLTETGRQIARLARSGRPGAGSRFETGRCPPRALEMSSAKALNTAAREIEDIFRKSGRKTGALPPFYRRTMLEPRTTCSM